MNVFLYPLQDHRIFPKCLFVCIINDAQMLTFFLTIFFITHQCEHWSGEKDISLILQKAERPSLNLCEQQTFP